jgi:rare lipoprotein A
VPLLLFTGEAQASSQQRAHHETSPPHLSGLASVYDCSSGEQTASGERLQDEAMTAAHPSLPFGTVVLVINEGNRHAVVVRINDRGPFVRGRIIDVSPAAARVLGFSGTTQVSLVVVSTSEGER